MILSDGDISRSLKSGRLVIRPRKNISIEPASVDLSLGRNFVVIDENKNGCLSLNSQAHYRKIRSRSFILSSHCFALATTQEWIELPNDLTAFVEGRSSIGRIGLFIQNAGWIDPGFKGTITLELYNANSLPIKLETGRRICQLVFCRMNRPALKPYRGKYQNQKSTTGSLIYKDKKYA
ncbi:MAG: dCTP deaminase [Candidatus Omnitrophota bacterium]|jgi:dCTP deaminase